jgi:hypothetical protein
LKRKDRDTQPEKPDWRSLLEKNFLLESLADSHVSQSDLLLNVTLPLSHLLQVQTDSLWSKIEFL